MSTEYFRKIFSKYKNKGVIIDTNLLLLYFIGKHKPSLISNFKRTRSYTTEDFSFIEDIFTYFKIIATTPNILTEVSNLSNHLQDAFKNDYYEEFKKQVLILNEKYIPSNEVCKLTQLNYLGLTDSVIIKAAKGKYLVITDDLPLYNILLSLKIDAINLNHIRTLSWFAQPIDSL